VITWTPGEEQGPSTNLIVTVVTDDGNPALSATNSFTVVVEEVNSAPVLPVQPDVTIAELETLVVTNSASDADLPANGLSYTLINPPAGAQIDAQGVITWTPFLKQGPSTNLIVTVVIDDGNPASSATNSFLVIVKPYNSPPSLPVQTNRTIPELTTLIVTNMGSDVETPASRLTYVLSEAPPGAVIQTNGIIVWTPTEEQGPGTNLFVTVLFDDGEPPLGATNSFVVVVEEVNSPPVLSAMPDLVLTGAVHLSLTNAATDPDIPMSILSYELLAAPAGATIDGAGVISWLPAPDQIPSTNLFTTAVWDGGVPPLSATNTFSVIVKLDPARMPPVIHSIEFLGGEVLVRWLGTAGVTYRLEYKDDFAATNWTAVLPDIVAGEDWVTATNVAPTASQRFYRVYVVP
jgi:hypothetical protein